MTGRIRNASLLCTATLVTAFVLQGSNGMAQTTVVINTGAPQEPLYAVGPIYVSSTLFYKYSRYAYLYTMAELSAAGIEPGSEIVSLGWMKSTNAMAPGPASFNIYMKNTNTTAYSDPNANWANLSNGAALVYQNNAQSIPPTASPNYIGFTLANPFIYTGGSLEILTEWDISLAATPIATGAFEWVNTQVADRIYGSGDMIMPTTLSSTSNNTSIDDRRPVIQIMYSGGVGTGRLVKEAQIGVFPNPTADALNVRNDSGDDFDPIEVMDITGKVVRMEAILRAGESRRINVADLGAGIYFLRMQRADGVFVKKFSVE